MESSRARRPAHYGNEVQSLVGILLRERGSVRLVAAGPRLSELAHSRANPGAAHDASSCSID